MHSRHQAVWVHSELSEFLESKVGVPQGSILGPLFFIIFFNDLTHEIENEIDNYADDTTLTATSSNIGDLESKLSTDCERISEWMVSNKLKLNPEKTHILTLGTEGRLRNMTDFVWVT